MDLLISRILKYLNGCLDDDHMYRIGNYVVKNYQNIADFTETDFFDEGFTKEELVDFCGHLGFDCYKDFKEKLLMDQQLRTDQLQARMLNIEDNHFIDYIETSSTKKEFIELIDELCEVMFNCQRIVIIGALYPSSVSVDFQTDMITLGKEVVEYHQFDKNFEFNKDDFVIIISATGRIMKAYVKLLIPCRLCDATIALITQNIKYTNYENICTDYVVHVKGKFDGIQFNYQIMMILDMLRIHYYKKYYQ